ncbi:hypothetical protein ACFWPX_35505 [Nocardia sp. NPDC058518]|uniref:hypothetical protein n=1 Tax=Nocardia sp. NPDC058518 TaxID=3346534 RepID=UPI00365CB0AD
MTQEFLTRLIADIESEFSQIGYVRNHRPDWPSDAINMADDLVATVVLVGGESDIANLHRAFWFDIGKRSLNRYEISGRISLISCDVADLWNRLPGPAQLEWNFKARIAGTVDEVSFNDPGFLGVMGVVVSSDETYPAHIAGKLRDVVSVRSEEWFDERADFNSLLAVVSRREKVKGKFARWNISPVPIRTALMLGVVNGEYRSVSRTIRWYSGRPVGMNTLDSVRRVMALNEFFIEESSGYKDYCIRNPFRRRLFARS